MVELDTQIEICTLLNYMKATDLEQLMVISISFFKMLSKLAQRND